MIDRFDVVVVGAGPGGIAAAAVAAEAGRRVCLLDNNVAPGGQIWRGFREDTAKRYPHGGEFLYWLTRLRKANCALWFSSQVIDSQRPGLLRLERSGQGCDLEFEQLVLATGARERFLPFPGWTLPGVMGAGGLQALVKTGLDPRNKRVVVAGSGPLLLAVAAGLARANARIVGTYEQAPLWRLAGFGMKLLGEPGKLIEGAGYRLKTLGAPYRTGSWVTRAEGRGRVESVTVTDGRTDWRQPCDWLACGFHLIPNLELPRLLGCRITRGYVEVDGLQKSTVPGVACVGELTGIGGLEKAIVEGQIAGWSAAGREVEARVLAPRLQKLQRFASQLDHAFALRSELRALAEAATAVCRCEDVSHAALKGCSSWREAKLHTRCGMGACQGRVCGAAAEFLFGWEISSVRPPIFPSATATLAGKADASPAVRC